MTHEELTAKLEALNQTLPADLRAALDPNAIRQRHEPSLNTAESSPTALVGAKPKSVGAALEAYAANPQLQIINGLLHLFVEAANAVIPQAFRSIPVNVFGDANNRLDPLNFHSSVSTRANGEVCAPRSCTSILGVSVCWPPVELCVGGGASAGLRELQGLSSARISGINIADVPPTPGNIVTVNGTLALTAASLGATGFAEAHGGPFGINIPVSASGSAAIVNVTITCAVVLTFDLAQPKLTGIQIQTLSVGYSWFWINISGLGAFNSLISPLINGLKAVVTPFFNVNGAISNAIKGVLQNQLNALVK